MAARSPVLSRVLAVHNGKGGVEKTTIVSNLAAIFAEAGYDILLIDVDPQANCGEDLGYTDQADDGGYLAAALRTQSALEPQLTVRDRLHVIPGGPALRRLEPPPGVDAFDMLVAGLEPIASNYTFVLIDTPPGGSALVDAALGVARWLLVPTRPDSSSIKGLSQVADSLEAAWASNETLELMGTVLTGTGSRETRIRAQALEQLEITLGDPSLLMRATIRHALKPARMARAAGRVFHELASEPERPFWDYLKSGERIPDTAASAPGLAQDMYYLADEVIARINEAEDQERES